MHQRVMEITGDPLPYGIEPNRKAIETLIAPRADAGHHHQAGERRRVVRALDARPDGVSDASVDHGLSPCETHHPRNCR